MPLPILQIVWFKRDLRVSDHAALAAAAAHGPVLPLYCVEPDYWAEQDTSARQYAFVVESLTELREDLAAIGQPLIVRTGDVPNILETFRRDAHIGGLWSHEETGNDWTYQRDKRVAAWCRQNGIPWTEFPQNGVIRRLSARNGWSRHWDRFTGMPVTATPPRLQPLSGFDPGIIPDRGDLALDVDPCPDRQQGGRGRALAVMESFFNSRGENYRSEMSSPLSAETSCSRLSPHLAYGTLSVREVAQATWAARERIGGMKGDTAKAWRQNLTSFQARLHWHCHFMQKLEDQTDMEWKNLHPAYNGVRGEDNTRLEAWCKGETGWPFVDACMRMLIATGWINFRMRAMLMAVASYHLWIDWRKPGEHLARLFTDYEPGIHWPQIQMQSGTTGINLPRIYNPIKQGYDQDPDGAFVRRWLPELAAVPDRYIHEPWLWEEAPRQVREAYPSPITDHLAAARHARSVIWSLRSGEEFKTVAREIQHKHGSRKGRRKRGSAKAQLSLFQDADA